MEGEIDRGRRKRGAFDGVRFQRKWGNGREWYQVWNFEQKMGSIHREERMGDFRIVS